MTDLEINHDDAQRKLISLRAESNDLPNELRRASDAAEFDRLRKRQAELPTEILEAEFKLCKAKLEILRAEQDEAREAHDRAKQKSRDTDERVKGRLSTLDAERKALNDEARADLIAAHRLNNQIQQRHLDIHRLEQELEGLMEQLFTPVV